LVIVVICDLRLIFDNLKAVAAGCLKGNTILPPAVFDNADRYGEIGHMSN